MPNVRGTRPRREKPLGRGGGAFRRTEVDQQEVRHARPDRPARLGQPVGQAAALGLDAGEVALEDRGVEQRLGHDRHRDRRHRPGRPVRVHPGDDLCVGDGEPDAQPREGIGLAGRAHDDEPRIRLAKRQERRPDELRVGLVEDDDRRFGWRPRRDRRGALRWCRRARPARSGCSGCTARRRCSRARPRGRRRRRAPSPRPVVAAGR